MPHQCVRCNKIFDDGSQEILTGCSCGAKLFFYIRKEKLEQAKAVQEQVSELSVKEKKQIEKDVFSIIGHEEKDDGAPVILDIEAINIKKPGKFELDLVHLFNKKEPLVYKLGDGKYVIDVAETFNRKNEDEE